ncbi:conserved hypothetical protein [Ricinus communis]|uniref:Uncharacterized protein n=1 Tax=Ricinus communis TaxID=3988 RepID=B9T685_RICCO|nr:conserved hypothetical protein [Ricinus communis]
MRHLLPPCRHPVSKPLCNTILSFSIGFLIVSNLCHNQGISMTPRPMFPSHSAVAGTEEFHDDDTDATYDDDDDAPFDYCN